jgi:hypothetical protein
MGGLTEREATVRFHSNLCLSWTEPTLPRILASSIYSVAGDTVEFGTMVSKPYTRLLRHPCIQSVGLGCYHGGGLYPDEATRRPESILPSVFHRPSGWCRQSLTPSERWMVYDVPWSITSLAPSLPAAVRSKTCKQLLPGRCLEYGLRHLLKGFGVMDEGVFSVFRGKAC